MNTYTWGQICSGDAPLSAYAILAGLAGMPDPPERLKLPLHLVHPEGTVAVAALDCEGDAYENIDEEQASTICALVLREDTGYYLFDLFEHSWELVRVS